MLGLPEEALPDRMRCCGVSLECIRLQSRCSNGCCNALAEAAEAAAARHLRGRITLHRAPIAPRADRVSIFSASTSERARARAFVSLQAILPLIGLRNRDISKPSTRTRVPRLGARNRFRARRRLTVRRSFLRIGKAPAERNRPWMHAEPLDSLGTAYLFVLRV